MKDGEVIEGIVRGEKPADSLVVGINQNAAQAINISSSAAPAGDRIASSISGRVSFRSRVSLLSLGCDWSVGTASKGGYNNRNEDHR
jgi:hypothetical protein